MANPSLSAIAYATALSKPLPLVGLSSSKYGGYAGLSVATVSVPGVWVLRFAFVQASAWVVAAGLLLLDDVESLPQATRNSATERRRRAGSLVTGQTLQVW